MPSVKAKETVQLYEKDDVKSYTDLTFLWNGSKTGRRNRTEFIDVEYHAYFAPVFVSLLVRNVISFKNYYYYEYRVLLFHLINH